MAVTKDDLKVGMRLQNNDPRYAGKDVTITAVDSKFAYYKANTRQAKIALARIYPVGSRRSQGYTVLADGE